MNKKLKNLIIIIIFLIFSVLRFYNLEKRIDLDRANYLLLGSTLGFLMAEINISSKHRGY